MNKREEDNQVKGKNETPGERKVDRTSLLHRCYVLYRRAHARCKMQDQQQQREDPEQPETLLDILTFEVSALAL